ncbi:unnamed protein product, partial [Brassica rapa subsp. trilocularis]
YWIQISLCSDSNVSPNTSHFSTLLFHGFTRAGEFLFSEVESVFSEIERRVFYLQLHC